MWLTTTNSNNKADCIVLFLSIYKLNLVELKQTSYKMKPTIFDYLTLDIVEILFNMVNEIPNLTAEKK